INGKQQYITHFAYSRPAKPRLRKTQKERVLVLVPACMAPSKIAVIGTRLDQTKRHGWTWKGMSCTIRTYKNPNVL
ncbi:MAG: hypothetical protein EBR54_09890, partial [Flavobacteriia bacterium]|nr:hypothetical protein [Flavobacteriia bacterium]